MANGNGNGKNGYWKGFVHGLLLIPVVGTIITVVGATVAIIVGKREIEGGQ